SLLCPPFPTQLILMFASGIPPLEQGADKKYGTRQEYWDYKNRTSVLVPFPTGKRRES
ncbi:unnamed protein product, partial [Discosporangium mesarthrocarpum]